MNYKKLFFPIILLSCFGILAKESDANVSKDEALLERFNYTVSKNDRLPNHQLSETEYNALADELYAAVKYGSMRDAERYFEARTLANDEKLNRKSQWVLLRLASERAANDNNNLTQEMIDEKYNALLNQPGACAQGAGVVNWGVRTVTWPLRTTCKPVRRGMEKGFDGACYTVGGILGASTLGMVIAAVPVCVAVVGISALLAMVGGGSMGGGSI